MQADKHDKGPDAADLDVEFTNNVFYGSGTRPHDSSTFDALAAKASWRTMRKISKDARAARKKHARQLAGNYTREEIDNWENEPGPMSKATFQKMKDDDLLLALNLERAVKARRKGQSYTVSHSLLDFEE